MSSKADKILLKLQKKVAFLKNPKIAQIAIASTLALHKERIFVKGEDSRNTPIGRYGTNPISIGRKQQVRQTGQTSFPGGYAEYKSLLGQNRVNLVNFGQMRDDYKFFTLGPNTYGYGFSNFKNAEKADGNERRFNKDIFQTTIAERNQVVTIMLAEARRVFK